MAQEELRIIWQSIRKWLARRSLGDWILGTVFIVPLFIISYGYGATVTRQAVLLVLTAVGWLIWAGRVFFSKKPVIWRATLYGRPALVLSAAVLLVSFFAGDLAEVWGGRGGLAESNPWGFLAALGLGLLITQTNCQTAKRLLTAYLLSSTLLALFVIAWFIFRQELIAPAVTSFAAVSLFFSVNALIVAAWALPLSGRVRLFPLAVLAVHLLTIFAYDYDLAWYVLGAGALVLSLWQLIWEKKLVAVDFITPFVLFGLSLVLLFAPAPAVSEKLGGSAINSVGAAVSYPRFFKYASWREKLLGAGWGRGGVSFWEKAERVDMRQVRQFPPLGNGFAGMLWDGGIMFILAWWGALIWLAARLGRQVRGSAGLSPVLLTLAVGSLGALAALALLPFDWLIFWAFIILTALLCAQAAGPKSATVGESVGARSFLFFGALALSALLVALSFFFWRQTQARFAFFRSIKVGDAESGTTVDLKLLSSAITRANGVYGYRLARIDLLAQALQEKAETGPLLISLAEDYDYLAGRRLSGAGWWQLAERAEIIARSADDGAAGPWRKRAADYYEKAVAALPRNVINLVDAARFYRQTGDDKFYQRAQELIDKALVIDATFAPAYSEKAELLVLAGKGEEAYDIMKKLADDNPAFSYNAGHLAFSAKKFEVAADYYKRAIAENANHLQARYELIQALMALSDFKSAGAELSELEKRVAADDAATQALLKGLKELLK